MGNMVTSIILGSMFYNMPQSTSSFFGRTVLLFFTSLVNTTLAAFEVRKLHSLHSLIIGLLCSQLTSSSLSRFGMIVQLSRNMFSTDFIMRLLKLSRPFRVICLISLSLHLYSTFLYTS